MAYNKHYFFFFMHLLVSWESADLDYGWLAGFADLGWTHSSVCGLPGEGRWSGDIGWLIGTVWLGNSTSYGIYPCLGLTGSPGMNKEGKNKRMKKNKQTRNTQDILRPRLEMAQFSLHSILPLAKASHVLFCFSVWIIAKSHDKMCGYREVGVKNWS